MSQVDETAPTGLNGPADGYESELPLGDLDRHLRPIRRVLGFAIRDLAQNTPQIRFFGVNGGRNVAQALRLDLPHAVRDQLATLSAKLAQFDDLPVDERSNRLAVMFATLTRLDAQLGLPFTGRLPAISALPGLSEGGPEPVTEEASAEGPVTARLEAPDLDDEAQGTGDRRYRLGDPAHTGASLASTGLDPELVAAFAEEGIETIADLLLLPPEGDELLRPLHGAGRDLPEGRIAVGGRIRARFTRISGGQRQTELILQGAGPLRVRWSKPVAPWFIERLAPETRITLVGELRREDGVAVLIDAEPVQADGHSVHLATYGLEGIDDSVVRVLLWRFLPEVDRIRDSLDHDALTRMGLPSLHDAIRDAHLKAKPEARRRLAFDEALLLQLGLLTPRFQASRERGIAHTLVHGLVTRLGQVVSLETSDDQQFALEDIKRDLRGPMPMLRVLTGTPGSGKFTAALLATAMVAEGKSQVLIIAPDATSAELRSLFAEPLLREIGLVGRLVVGDPSRAQRDAIRRGEVHVVFGTAELLDLDLEFRRLGLVIAEERDNHGAVPAKVAQMRSPRPDMLVLGTLPIPSAVLLSAYGDHDLSLIDAKVSAPKVTLIDDDHRNDAYRRITEVVRSGRQALVLFPLAKGGADEPEAGVDVLDLREAKAVADAISTEMLAGARVGLFHSGLPREDRQRAYDDFLHRRFDVLVATSPIEDGPRVPAATAVIIEQADKMPLHRLQRILGHVARGTGEEAEVYCVVGRNPHPAGLQRIQQLMVTPDPWALAEWDLRERGLEAVLARDIHGGARLRWLDPSTDRQLLVWARERAHEMLADDPTLRRGVHGDIARALRERWDDLVNTPYPLADGSPSQSTSGAASRKRRRRRKRK